MCCGFRGSDGLLRAPRFMMIGEQSGLFVAFVTFLTGSSEAAFLGGAAQPKQQLHAVHSQRVIAMSTKYQADIPMGRRGRDPGFCTGLP